MTKGTRAGFHCAVCDVILSDSQAYLAHINGRKHQKALGVSMHVRRASVTDVRARIAHHVRRLAEGAAGGGKAAESVAERLERVRQEKERAEAVARAARAMKKKNRRKRLRGDDASDSGGGVNEGDDDDDGDGDENDNDAPVKRSHFASISANDQNGGDDDEDVDMYYDDGVTNEVDDDANIDNSRGTGADRDKRHIDVDANGDEAYLSGSESGSDDEEAKARIAAMRAAHKASLPDAGAGSGDSARGSGGGGVYAEPAVDGEDGELQLRRAQARVLEMSEAEVAAAVLRGQQEEQEDDEGGSGDWAAGGDAGMYFDEE